MDFKKGALLDSARCEGHNRHAATTNRGFFILEFFLVGILRSF